MGDTLVINSSPTEVRVALLENGTPVEVYIEREAHRDVAGNIYRGRVVRVLPGMQAAFVDLGLQRTAFLYVDDALPLARIKASEGDKRQASAEGTELTATSPPQPSISSILSAGQELIVQVQKEPLGSKGARITRHVSLPGRFTVFMPFAPNTVGISQRITDPTERERLRDSLEPECGEQGGFILRTAAEGIDAERLRQEARILRQLWQRIATDGSGGPAPRLLFSNLDLPLRAIRDLYTNDVEQVVVDNPLDLERIRSFMNTFTSHSRATLYTGREPVFDHYGVEVEFQRALERKVWLKSGGYIIIDQTEALAAIDVNSGRFVGKTNLEETITQTNLEAVKEVAYQLRLRNIGGIVIIDFIDMMQEENRQKVFGALEEALKRDKAKSTIVRMSEIGLVEMTRKRIRESLVQALTDRCPYCKGQGYVKSEHTIANEILRTLAGILARQAPARAGIATVLVNVQADVANCFYDDELTREIARLEAQHGVQIIPVAREGFHREYYHIVSDSGPEGTLVEHATEHPWMRAC